MKTDTDSLADMAESLAKLCGRASQHFEREREASLSLRDRFALAALPSVVRAISEMPEWQQPKSSTAFRRAAKVSYAQADAMLAERAKPVKSKPGQAEDDK